MACAVERLSEPASPTEFGRNGQRLVHGRTRWPLLAAVWIAVCAALGTALFTDTSSFGYRAQRVVLTRGEGAIPHKFELITRKRVRWLPGPQERLQAVSREEFLSYASQLGGIPQVLPTGFAMIIARDPTMAARSLDLTEQLVDRYLRDGK